MASPIIAPLITELTETRGVLQSATLYVQSVPGLVQTAIEAALVNGATEAELAPLIELQAGLDNDGNALVAAIQANGGSTVR